MARRMGGNSLNINNHKNSKTMRKMIYMAPVESMSGKWAQTSKSTYLNDVGKMYNRFIISQSRVRRFAKGDGGRVNYYAFRSESNAHNLTAAEAATRTLFATRTAQVRAIYADVQQYTAIRAQWQASGESVTLRQYIWSHLPNP